MDEVWVDRIKNREEAALLEVIQTYGKVLYVVAATVLTEQTPQRQLEIEEVVQDAFFSLWNKPKKFDPNRGTLKSLLIVKTISLAKNKIRKNQREFKKMKKLYELRVLESDLGFTVDISDVFEAILRFDEKTREILLHRFIYEEKPQTISRLLGIPIKEVNNRIYRGKKKLIDYCEEAGHNEDE